MDLKANLGATDSEVAMEVSEAAMEVALDHMGVTEAMDPVDSDTSDKNKLYML